MKVIHKTREHNIATVYIARSDDGRMIEFVESVQPPFSREEKWVLIVSTLFGCPVRCRFCDAGGDYAGGLSYEQINFQIDYMIERRFASNAINVKRLKIQFARMGEPSFNDNVLEVLESLPARYNFGNFIPSISTTAPVGREKFFERLLKIKNDIYKNSFQLQFSIHSTDRRRRDYLIPFKKWDLEKISEFGRSFYNVGNRKIALNFALAKRSIIDPETLLRYFDPAVFMIKITPVNPTFKAKKNRIESFIEPNKKDYDIIDELKQAGFDVILSIGPLEENKIGSNCGQYVHSIKNNNRTFSESCTYPLEDV